MPTHNIGIVGLPGTGKSATMVYLAYTLYHKRGRKVLSNTPLAFQYTPVPRPVVQKGVKDLPAAWDNLMGDPENLRLHAAFCLDEIDKWLDSREFMSTKNIVLAEFFTQMRKRGFDCLWTSQDFSFLERRMRRITTQIIECLEVKHGIMRGRIWYPPFNRPQQPEPAFLHVGGIFSLYDTYHKIKRA